MGLSLLRALRTARRSLGALALAILVCGSAHATRVKDIASVKGVRSNQLVGYGLVVGLAGSGDRRGTDFTVQSLASVLGGMGIGVDPAAIQVKNVAAVMITATLTPFARTGARLDAVVSSIGDATSLEGGTLVLTPLYGVDGEVYALAQGALSVGGFNVSSGGGSSVQKNHPTVGRLVGGATVEREVPWALDAANGFQLALQRADFTTAVRMATAINQALGGEVAAASDPGTISIQIPEGHPGGVVSFLADLEAVEVEPDKIGRVVLNERTGTVVMGETVRLGTVAIAHGSLSVSITAINDVSQPAPFSEGETTAVRNDIVETTEEAPAVNLLEGPVTIDQLVRGLNAMGVTPRDLIAILQAIKAAGALSAELELM